MTRHLHLVNIILALIVLSQAITWMAGPYSGYLFMRVFIGLAMLSLGIYGAYYWKQHDRPRRVVVLLIILVGLAFVFEYEPIVTLILR